MFSTTPKYGWVSGSNVLLLVAMGCIALASDSSIWRSNDLQVGQRDFTCICYMPHLSCAPKGRPIMNCVWFQRGISNGTKRLPFTTRLISPSAWWRSTGLTSRHRWASLCHLHAILRLRCRLRLFRHQMERQSLTANHLSIRILAVRQTEMMPLILEFVYIKK